MSDNNGNNGHGNVVEIPKLDFTGKPFTETPLEHFNGAEILAKITAFIRRFIHLSEAQARLIAVWVCHTHAISAADCTLYLNITSATKLCGKTRLLQVLQLLVAKPWLTGRVSAACLYRKVDQVRPTLLLDESDAAFNGVEEYAEALRGILDTGSYADGAASVCVGQGASMSFRDFRTYCAKAIAGIGSLPDTVASRSAPIILQRKRPGETVARFRRRKAKDEARPVKTQIENWMASIVDQLRNAEPALPEQLNDRQIDGVEPLLAIADAAGGEWPEALRLAVAEIFQAAEDDNLGVQLLADIKSIFDADGERIASADLVSKLKEIATSPWADWGGGKGLSQNGLARLLKPFGIRPHGTIRVDEKTAKGYTRESFQDAFERYLTHEPSRSDFPTVTPSQPACLLVETDFSNRHKKVDVTDRKSASNPHEYCIVTDVTDEKSHRAGVDTNGDVYTPLYEDIELPCRVHGRHRKWWVRILPDGGEATCGMCEPMAGNEQLSFFQQPRTPNGASVQRGGEESGAQAAN